MEHYYYIPVNSLNFNNILSSESISPISFYEKRGYGFKRFERISANPLVNSILAYNKILLLDTPKSDREEFPLHVAVPKTYFDKGFKTIQNSGISIIQTDASIYINWKECFFIVNNETDRKKLIAGTKRSLEIKHAELYVKNIFVLNEYSLDTIAWDEAFLESISDYKNSNQEQIAKDKKINKIRGLVYGFVAGKLKEQPNEITEGKRYFQDFINAYSVLMNELSILSNDSHKKSGIVDKARINVELEYLNDLKERINILFGGNEQIESENAIKNAFGLATKEIEFLQSHKYEKTRNTLYSIISTFVKERNNELYTIDELLDTLIQKAKSFVNTNSYSLYKTLDETFNSYRVLINSKISSYQNDIVISNSLDKIPFSISKDFSISDLEIEGLKKDENNSFHMVCNELLLRLELSTSDEIAQQRLDIIQNIAESLNKYFKKDSEELEYLRRLYKSFKTVGVGFKIDESTNLTLQALACFLSRYGELDKLQDFMERNKFNNFGLTYAYWGAAYGYANLSKILLESIDSNSEVLDMVSDNISRITIDEVLEKNKMIQFLNLNQNLETKAPTKEWKIGKESKVEEPQNEYSKKESFINVIEKSTNLNKNVAWISTINKCYVTIENEGDIGGPLFDKPFKIKEFERLLLEEKNRGNLKGFGQAKIDEVISVFKEFIN